MRVRQVARMLTGLSARLGWRGAATALLMCCAASAQAHGAGGDDLPGWDLAQWLVALMLLSLTLYARGFARLLRRSRQGRAGLWRQVGWFAAGWLTLVIALMSPLDGMGDALFSAHMVQHELLMIVAAPCMVLSRPLVVWTWALPARWRRAVGGGVHAPTVRAPWKVLTSPLFAFVAHALVLWGWHLPPLFQAALRHEGIHVAQHASFFLTALMFWWTVLRRQTRADARTARTPGTGVALASLFATMLHTGVLGALLTFSTRPWYPFYGDATAPWGLSALGDQQLGGLIMWIPGGASYLLASVVLCWRWFAEQPSPAPHRPPA